MFVFAVKKESAWLLDSEYSVRRRKSGDGDVWCGDETFDPVREEKSTQCRMKSDEEGTEDENCTKQSAPEPGTSNTEQERTRLSMMQKKAWH